jgi:hypothetical protein
MYGDLLLLLQKEGLDIMFFLIDNNTRYCLVYLMKHRSKFFEIYTTFQALIKTQHFIVIKCFRCDLGEEYISNKFYELLTLDEIIYQTSCTDTPEQNGVVEKNIGILSKLLVLSCYLLLFLVSFGEKLPLLLQV